MSIVGIFTRARPRIGALYFDAVLSESSELLTDVTEFPIETGAIGNDHAVQRPLTLTMRVGVSDNPARALRAEAGDATGLLAGAAVGGFLSGVSENIAIASGIAASEVNAAYTAGQDPVRSQSVLDAVRDIQRANRIVSIVTLKRQYENVMITGTRQETNKENEGGLELIVDMKQLLTVPPEEEDTIPAQDDPASTQAQKEEDLGQVVPQ